MQDGHETDIHGSQGGGAEGALQKALDRCVSYIIPNRLLHLPGIAKYIDTVLAFTHLYASQSKVENDASDTDPPGVSTDPCRQ